MFFCGIVKYFLFLFIKTSFHHTLMVFSLPLRTSLGGCSSVGGDLAQKKSSKYISWVYLFVFIY
jgi:hypothetical protein